MTEEENPVMDLLFYAIIFLTIGLLSGVIGAAIAGIGAKSYACEHRCNELGYTGSEIDDGCWCTESDRKEKVNYALEIW